MAVVLAACAPQSAPLPSRPVPAGPGIVVQAAPVPLNPGDPKDIQIGAFTYAGGLALTSDQTSRLHGLSDLKVWPDGRLLAIGDEGDLLQAHLELDAAGRPTGLTNARLTAITGEDGQPLNARGKQESDAEGIAELANGDLLVSLEEDDRILLYPHDGGPPRRAPMPDVKFPFNEGMEALAAYPAAGPDAYVVGGETSGETWICRLSATCVKDRTVAKGAEYGLVAVQPLPAGRIAYLLRAYDPLRGARITLRIVGAGGAVDGELELAGPRTVDNFEGLAAVPGRHGGIRLYIISDDNFSSSQRTLLLAFDWRPSPGT
ncbi:MAG: esterase-like activity of phytase family protein [Phenylobacterium sp.]